MRVFWDTDKALFERETFRRWMVSLNRKGGVVLLDAMGEEDLRRLVSEEAKAALRGITVDNLNPRTDPGAYRESAHAA